MAIQQQKSLVDIPWPISILKFNQWVEDMREGEALSITLKDGDIRDNLVMLLNAMPGLTFVLEESRTGYRLTVEKRISAP